jgi:hypothetical protein
MQMGRPSDRPPFLLPRFLTAAFFVAAFFYCHILVILNLFQDTVPPLVILKQVQDDENAACYPETSSG